MIRNILRLAAVPLVVLGLLVVPVPEAQAQDDKRSMEELRDQGMAYYKRKRFKPAKAMLDKAFAKPSGPKDFKTVFYRGQAAYKLLYLEDAFAMAKLAQKLAEKKRQSGIAKTIAIHVRVAQHSEGSVLMLCENTY